MSYLAEYPVDIIKTDMAFVQAIPVIQKKKYSQNILWNWGNL
jgi:EAL domain-containing protein (putative c-di-GMP-specific phosphodiesterase class I)